MLNFKVLHIHRDFKEALFCNYCTADMCCYRTGKGLIKNFNKKSPAELLSILKMLQEGKYIKCFHSSGFLLESYLRKTRIKLL